MAIMQHRSTGDYIVKPVAKALQTLIVLGEAGEDLSLAELCTRLDLPKTTVFRYLNTLEAFRFVEHDSEKDRYRLGWQLWHLGSTNWAISRVQEVAIGPMQDLRDMFDETVNLGVLDGPDVVYLEMAESRRALRMQARLGGHDPASTTALGRAMLAALPASLLDAHLPETLPVRTGKSLPALAALMPELAATRARGYSLDDEENEDGARCVGAVIVDWQDRPVAAISLSAPVSRLPAHRIEMVAVEVQRTAARISLLLKHARNETPASR
jgi:IclR family acetate operon transcriptional repressor